MNAGSIRALTDTELITFIGASDYLSVAQRQLSHGWKFVPFDRDPSHAIAPLAYRVGYWHKDRLCGVLCIQQEPTHQDGVSLSFLDGEPAAMDHLLHHALNAYEGSTMHMMVPVHQGQHVSAMELLRRLDFTSWSEFKADVFVYTMAL